MEVPIPCAFGEIGKCKNRFLIFNGVQWFKWSTGYEYTYLFETNNPWIQSDFYASDGKEFKTFMSIDERLLEDKPFIEHGYPLVGRGYMSGFDYKNGKLYTDMILTSHYLMHLKVECDEHGRYIENGKIIFPPTPSCETVDKRKKFLLKKYQHLVD